MGVSLDKGGTIVVSQATATSLEGVFAGGDAAGTRAFVADAIASGKKGALAISCYLEGVDEANEYERRRIGKGSSFAFSLPDGVDLKDVVTSDKVNTICTPFASRNENPLSAAPDQGKTFGELVEGLGTAQAEKEMGRCFKCGTCTQCDLCFLICPDISIVKGHNGYSLRAEYCKGCGVCAATCPRHAVQMGGAQ
jgi:Pyruvate/2-oxoacid:ferredoxin oxidoreductase delta subunit